MVGLDEFISVRRTKLSRAVLALCVQCEPYLDVKVVWRPLVQELRILVEVNDFQVSPAGLKKAEPGYARSSISADLGANYRKRLGESAKKRQRH